MIAAGRLTQSITFYTRSDQQESDYGSIDGTFAEGITCRAAVKFVSGAETILSETLANTTVVQFMIRYRAAISEEMKIAWDGAEYAIKVIEQDEKKTMLTITTTKIVV